MAAKVIATWKGIDQVEKNIANFDAGMKKLIADQVMRVEPEMTAYAKKNAPWQDQSGAARAGLFTTHSIQDNAAELVVSHTVPYGIWLEVRWSGKYAIIGPTIFWGGKLLIGRIDALLKRLSEIKR